MKKYIYRTIISLIAVGVSALFAWQDISESFSFKIAGQSASMDVAFMVLILPGLLFGPIQGALTGILTGIVALLINAADFSVDGKALITWTINGLIGAIAVILFWLVKSGGRAVFMIVGFLAVAAFAVIVGVLAGIIGNHSTIWWVLYGVGIAVALILVFFASKLGAFAMSMMAPFLIAALVMILKGLLVDLVISKNMFDAGVWKTMTTTGHNGMQAIKDAGGIPTLMILNVPVLGVITLGITYFASHTKTNVIWFPIRMKTKGKEIN